MSTIEALGTSLVELSKHPNLHYESIAEQLHHTRMLILRLEGHDVLEIEKTIKQIEELNGEADALSADIKHKKEQITFDTCPSNDM